jgi:7-carboxy-7-deazaguanine synthase (Cx14CxxC type)
MRCSHEQACRVAYVVKEIFYTLQGEGAHAGRAAVFCRFAGCNLWSGREADRAKAICNFCDTEFIGTDGPGGGRFERSDDLARAVAETWPTPTPGAQRSAAPDSLSGTPFVVCTGGEPLLQLDAAAVDAFHARGFEVAVETNGTQTPPKGIDWICVSPKAGASLKLTAGHELKLVYPQPAAMPPQFEHLDFQRFYLQPMDGPDRERNTRLAVEYCLAHPKWRLSLQTHKQLGIP